MTAINHHDKPFTEETLIKLDIFQAYAKVWIPTFAMQGSVSEIFIFDLFAGTGYDKAHVPGSPIRILSTIKEFLGTLYNQNTQITLYLNEFNPAKYKLLKEACDNFVIENRLGGVLTIRYFNKDFALLFPELLPLMGTKPSLIYLDQNGIKFLSNNILLALEKLNQTDFIYFVASSYFYRFGTQEEFKKHVDVDMTRLLEKGYPFVHKQLVMLLKEKLPLNSRLEMYPFSIKKGTNIYGIIFGAKHPRAFDKFLALAWKQNKVNGEASYDINKEDGGFCGNLFDDPELTKIGAFQNRFKGLVLNGEISTNALALRYVYENGHIPSHAAEVMRELKRKGVITYEGRSPLITYDNVYKKPNIITYKLTNENNKD